MTFRAEKFIICNGAFRSIVTTVQYKFFSGKIISKGNIKLYSDLKLNELRINLSTQLRVSKI